MPDRRSRGAAAAAPAPSPRRRPRHHHVARLAFLLLSLACARLADGSTLDPGRTPGENFDLTGWYLGTPDAGQSVSIPAVNLVYGYTSPWFFTAPDGAMAFWAPVTGGTTSGTTYPRSELREQINPPENSRNWTVHGNHVLEAECRVRILPSNGKVIIGQIHGYLGAARPLIKLMLNNGVPDAIVKHSPASDYETHNYFPRVPPDSLIAYRIQLQDGHLRCTVNGQTLTFDILSQDPAWAEQTFYFKAGAYLGDNVGPSTEGARIDFYRLQTMHENVPQETPAIVRPPVPLSAPATSNAVLSVVASGGLPLHYQWHYEGVPIPGATLSYLPLRSLDPSQAGLYHATISNLTGAVTSAPARLTVLEATPAFTLAEALDTTNLTWTTSGSPPWFGTYGTAPDGIDQAQAGPIDDNSAVTLQTTVTGPGQVRFSWRVSSQTNDDFLIFSVGGSTQARISGTVPWEERAFPVPAGSQVLSWTYQKGPQLRGSSDRAWVDGVRFLPEPPTVTSHPAGTNVHAGSTILLSVTAHGPGPLRYQWQCEGTNLVETTAIRGTTNATLTLSNVQPAQAGAYRVLVGNAGGETASAHALVSISLIPPLPEALDAPQFAWTSSSQLPWTGQAATSRDGIDAARSGRISHSQSSMLQTIVTGPGTLQFWWKVSSEPGNDRLIFSRNGSEVARLSGEVDWQPCSLALPAGTHTLRWTYSKNGSVVQGQDAAWIDGLNYAPLLPPAAPADLAATPLSLSTIRLDWTDLAGNEAGFLLEGSTNGTTFSPVASLVSNTVCFVRTGLLAATTWQFRLRATNAAGASPWAGPASATTLPFTGARINFQPASAPVPAGCLVDAGLAYASRGNGLAYGWNSARTSSAVDRNSLLSPDQRHDTYVSSATSTSIRWELAVPEGDYHVFLIAGDPSSTSGSQRFSVEGYPAILGSLSASQRWISNRVNVRVRDGRLSISNLAGASNNKLCFLEITRLTPLLDCPADFTAEAGQPWEFTPPTPKPDPCGTGIVSVLIAGTVTNGTAPCLGPLRIARTWIAHDSCGNSNICTQTVTLVDNTPPVLLTTLTNLCDPMLQPLPAAADAGGAAPLVSCHRDDGQPAGTPFLPGTNLLHCTATDACGLSVTGAFHVVLPPLLSAGGPISQTIAAGETATFTASVAAGEAISIQWRFQDQPLPGATNLTLVLPAVTAAQAGTYCVHLTGHCDQVILCAELLVAPPPEPIRE